MNFSLQPGAYNFDEDARSYIDVSIDGLVNFFGDRINRAALNTVIYRELSKAGCIIFMHPALLNVLIVS